MESNRTDSLSVAKRVRQASVRLALATATSSVVVVLAADVAWARIAVNHNEVAANDHLRHRGR